MNDAVYEIRMKHDPSAIDQWSGQVFRISDGTYMSGSTQIADTEIDVIEACQKWITEQREQKEPYTLYADDLGNLVDGHSVRV